MEVGGANSTVLSGLEGVEGGRERPSNMSNDLFLKHSSVISLDLECPVGRAWYCVGGKFRSS